MSRRPVRLAVVLVMSLVGWLILTPFLDVVLLRLADPFLALVDPGVELLEMPDGVVVDRAAVATRTLPGLVVAEVHLPLILLPLLAAWPERRVHLESRRLVVGGGVLLFGLVVALVLSALAVAPVIPRPSNARALLTDFAGVSSGAYRIGGRFALVIGIGLWVGRARGDDEPVR